MRHSESIAKLAAALVKANAEVQHATKDRTNPHFKNDYATLESVLNAVKPVYATHGLAIVQLPGFEDGRATLDTVVVHESGEWLAGLAGSPIQKQDPQGVGSALTYLRRYAVAAVAGIAQVDDDGNAGAGRDDVDVLTAEVRKLLRGAVPDAGRKAALEAIDSGDIARLRAAVAWLHDNAGGGK